MSPSRILALAFALIPAACSSTSEQRVPLPDQTVTVTRPELTRIYFVREDHIGLQFREIKVLDGETEIGLLTPDTFLCWERPGGRTLGRAFYETADRTRGRVEGVADLNCAAGQAYYFNVTVGRDEGQPSVSPLDVEEGRRLVAARKPAKH
jgi:hypothetical protein